MNGNRILSLVAALALSAGVAAAQQPATGAQRGDSATVHRASTKSSKHHRKHHRKHKSSSSSGASGASSSSTSKHP